MGTKKNGDCPEFQGIIPIDKPCGMTSHDVVFKMRKLYATKKTGHTGTLDPMATGVLVVLIGRAAKAAEYLTYDSKTYKTTLRLGMTTDTEDISGTVLSTSDEIPDKNEVFRVISSLPPCCFMPLSYNRKPKNTTNNGLKTRNQQLQLHFQAVFIILWAVRWGDYRVWEAPPRFPKQNTREAYRPSAVSRNT